MPVEDILKTPFDAHFIVDGHVLTRSPFDAYEDGGENDVDLLLGTNADEGRLFFHNKAVTVNNFNSVLASDFSPAVVWLMDPKSGTTDSEARASAAAFDGDMRFRWDMWTWAKLAANHGKTKVFFYQFSRSPPFAAGTRYFGLGATHGMEMPYVFDHLDQQRVPWTIQDRRLASVMSAYWTNFASSGDPNGPGLPHWPEFNSSTQQAMVLGDEIGSEAIPHQGGLRRIDAVYASIRFALKYRYAVLAVATLIAVTVAAAIVVAYRRRRRLRVAS
jgi:para-nitrobenzyl esterase